MEGSVERPPTQPRRNQYRAPSPGVLVLTFNVMVLATGWEHRFPHRREYWHTILPRTLGQACACFSCERWVHELHNAEMKMSC